MFNVMYILYQALQANEMMMFMSHGLGEPVRDQYLDQIMSKSQSGTSVMG